ncbi:MAG TPA: VWA domain-containing protein [Bryobacteraceae bacterium]|jgi:VWFA-related protein|nr:VWA domain-containing protein [Bryobacteraceae bacterium]
MRRSADPPTILPILLIVTLLAGPQTIAAQDASTLKATAQEVLLDFVARDKHDKAVTDLSAAEIEVYEDGVRQHLNSFRYRSGEPEMASSGQLAQFDPLRELNLVSIVFEGMSAESRRRATEYALDFLQTGAGPNTWMGVFTLNHRLSVIQPYTNDLNLLRAAVRRAGSGEYQSFARESEQRLNRMNSLQAGSDPLLAARYRPLVPGSAEDGGPATGLTKAEAGVLLAIEKAMLKAAYQQSGSRTIDALSDLVRAQAMLPGRKTILYSCEGLVVPPEQPELLRSIISQANRANVSFYTLDARGLQLRDSNASAQLATSAMTDEPFSGGSTMPVSLQTDVQANARELAKGTGGFAMDNSNDLRGPLHRVMDDVRAHYEVTYTPPARALDGRFRTIEVKILRPGVKVQSRKGYFAVPLLNGEPLQLYEVAALRALNMRPPPRAVDFAFSALDLGRTPAGAQYVLTFSVPSQNVHLETDSSASRLVMHVTCFALLKQIGVPLGGDPASETVVSKVSRDLPYSFPLDRRREVEAGTVTATLPLLVAPGRYHVEAVLTDIGSGAAGVRRIPLMVEQQASATVQMSDLVWVRSVRPHVSRDQPDPLDPLDTPYGRITPEITGTFSAGSKPAFFFRLFRISAAATARLTLSKNGAPVQSIDLRLASPDSEGTVAFLGQLPAAGLAPGQYDVGLAVNAGAAHLSRLTSLTLAAQ